MRKSHPVSPRKVNIPEEPKCIGLRANVQGEEQKVEQLEVMVLIKERFAKLTQSRSPSTL
jgi:hypothetical protein